MRNLKITFLSLVALVCMTVSAMAQQNVPRTKVAEKNGVVVEYEIHFIKTIKKKKTTRDQYKLVVYVTNTQNHLLISDNGLIGGVSVTNKVGGLGGNVSHTITAPNVQENKYELPANYQQTKSSNFKVNSGTTPSVSFNVGNFIMPPPGYVDYPPSGNWVSQSSQAPYTITMTNTAIGTPGQNCSFTVNGRVYNWRKDKKNHYIREYKIGLETFTATLLMKDQNTLIYTSPEGEVSTWIRQ